MALTAALALACATPPCPRSIDVSGDTEGTGWVTLSFELGVRERDCPALNGGRVEKEDGVVYWVENEEGEWVEETDAQ